MSVVFLVAAGVLVLAFIASLFLPQVDLGPKPGAATQSADGVPDDVTPLAAGH
jgi:hypothetical protein